ncbi:hypothetical protein F52700_11748 [Fusarium sp. NRRL 52700]|nr:hypothetical protein F52700_11748 [Fusarium sp. NRRL 52700]
MSFQPTNGLPLALDMSGREPGAGLRQLATLDKAHLDTVTNAITRVLDTDIAEITYAQIVDGLPLGEVAFESRGGMPHQDHPINHCHDELCAGILYKAREFRSRFDPLVLKFDSRLLCAYQAASPGSRSFNTRLIEILAIAVHQIAVLLFSLEEGLHKNDGVIEWAPPKSEKTWWAHCPNGPEPTMFFHPWYSSHEKYPKGVADMVGYWAENRILGGVVLFDRRQPVPGSGVDPDAVYIHPDREDVTYRICRLTSEQKLRLLKFLTAEESGHNPLPILADEKNNFRVDPEESPEETGIYRDIWDRSELREDENDTPLDVALCARKSPVMKPTVNQKVTGFVVPPISTAFLTPLIFFLPPSLVPITIAMEKDNIMKGFTPSPGSSSSAHTDSSIKDEKKDALHPVPKGQYQLDVLKIAERTYPKELPPGSNTMLIHHIRVSGAYADARDEFAAISQPTALGWSEVHCLYKYLLSFELSHPDSRASGHLTKYRDLHYFLTAVFFNWDSGKEFGLQPVLPEQVFDDYAKDVGLLIRDLDPIVNKDGSLYTSGRCMWDQAYLAFKVNQETLEWHVSWVDYNGNSLKRQDVQLYDEYKDNYKEAFNATIENFDRKQSQRIMAYN